MMILKENEPCPYSLKCKYTDDCEGPNSNRISTFRCEFVTNGVIQDDKSRTILDKTGKMQILSEGL